MRKSLFSLLALAALSLAVVACSNPPGDPQPPEPTPVATETPNDDPTTGTLPTATPVNETEFNASVSAPVTQ
jgi:hypothetical protein